MLQLPNNHRNSKSFITHYQSEYLYLFYYIIIIILLFYYYIIIIDFDECYKRENVMLRLYSLNADRPLHG